MSGKYKVKTYFQREEKSFSNHLLEMVYATLLPAFCVIMARDFKEYFFVALMFWLFFFVLMFLQVRVRVN